MHFFKLLIFSILFLGACQNEPDTAVESTPYKFHFDAYQRKKELSLYVRKELSAEVSDAAFDTLYFIPLNSCDKCVQTVFRSLIRNNHEGTVILGGKPELATAFTKELDQLKNQRIFVDSNYMMQKYNLDIYGPTIILHGAKKKPLFLNLDYKNWELVATEFGWK